MERNKAFEFLNTIKDPALKNAILSHGIGSQSELAKYVTKANGNAEFRNSTEPRMTVYTAEINDYLYSDNSFIMKSINDAAFAASGETKVLNDGSIGPNVTKGRVYSQALTNLANAPQQTVKIRKNTSHEWPIEYFHTDPQSITMELRSEVPYEVRQDLLKAHSMNLMQSVANYTAVEWSQGAVGVAETGINVVNGTDQFVFSTGENRANAIVGGSGTVKKITRQDMQNVKKAFRRQQIGQMGGMIYFLPTVEQYDDLLSIPEFVDYEKTGQTSKRIMGEVGVLFGMTILEPRHNESWSANSLYSYTALSSGATDLTKVEDTASSGANMASAGIAWMENQVKRAQGSAIVFPWMNSPIYLGDVYATEMRYGAIKKRGDNKGVVMLIDSPFTS